MASIGSDDLQIPGTVYLVDVAQHHEAGTNTQHDGSHQDIVLVPQPSSDPEDPLNWSYRRKLLAVSMGYLYVLGTGIATSLQYSVLADITADTGIQLPDLVSGTGLMFLFFGWACLIWQPIALTYGRRGVYLITMFLTIPIMVWTAYSSSAGEWAAHRVLIGIIVSPIESLCEVTIFDLFFAHNRGTYMGLYVFVLFGSNFLAPLFAGWFNDAYGWRWTMHLGAIVCAVALVLMFFFLEETIYFRGQTIDGLETRPVAPTGGITETKSEKENTDNQSASSSGPGCVDTKSRASSPAQKQGFLGKYALFRPLPGRPSNREMLKMVYRPLVMIFRLPTVAWSGFLYGINLAWYNVLNGTVSPVLTSNPYHWSAALVGCVYAGPIIGAAFACLWSGKVADRVAIHLARRHNGVREAEYRLWVLGISGIISAAGLILWGVGAYHELHWVGLVFGLGMLTFGVVTGGSIAVSYNVDCFKEIAGETTVSVMVIRNTIGFGFSYGITPWWTNTGLQNCFIAAAMISVACTATFLIFVVYGKRIRKWSIPAYQRFIATTVVSQE
ncbi:major facilitator superfamily protein [Microdochium bolleyi]|uniref:Major facilitator superfamily protein n=1 Tax=Microdochium bolleyi TaxID=196109 RepID=A0A136ITW3_9PEZI|nr:major facilitator superfamily protein [Microdochium bolleyi]